MPDHGGRVQPCRRALDGVEVLGEALEGPWNAGLEGLDRHALDVLEGAGDGGAVLGPGRGDAEATVAHHHRGHAVPAGGCEVAVPQHLGVVVGVDVDEAGSQYEPVEVDLGGAIGGDVTDGRDAPAFDSHVGPASRCARAVDEVPVAEYDVHQSSW